MSSAHAAALGYGRLTLVLGDELGVTAKEVAAKGDGTRLSESDLLATRTALAVRDVRLDGLETLVIMDDPSDGVRLADDAEASIKPTLAEYGDAEQTLIQALRALDSHDRLSMLAEAGAAAWRQRLSDAADTALPLSRADAEVIGRIMVLGYPLLTELRAKRRRALVSEGPARMGAGPNTPVDDAVRAAMMSAIDSLRSTVEFGAAGLAETASDEVPHEIARAVGDDGWVTRLRLLLAAEEIYAIELLLASRAINADASESDVSSLQTTILEQIDVHRRSSESLAALLSDVQDRLPTDSTNPVRRLTGRQSRKNRRLLIDAMSAYMAVTRSTNAPDVQSVSWEEARSSLGDFDKITDTPSSTKQLATVESNWKSFAFGTTEPPTLEEIAELLGGLFSQQLQVARKRVDELRHRHPDEGAEALITRVKRQAITELCLPSTGSDEKRPVVETVATLTMAIAILRGAEPRSASEFESLGLKILSQAQRFAKVQDFAEGTMPAAFAGFERLVRVIQPAVVEGVFHAMSAAKPPQSGPARDIWKLLRSQVWRARHNRNVAAAAASGANQVLGHALDGGTARILVRQVDRALKVRAQK